MSNQMTAADRLKQLRELMGLQREDFAKLLGMEFSRYKNLELKRGRINEEEFAAIGAVLPDFLHWIICAGDLEWEALQSSQSVWTKLIGARIEAGQVNTVLPLNKQHIELVRNGDQDS